MVGDAALDTLTDCVNVHPLESVITPNQLPGAILVAIVPTCGGAVFQLIV